MRHSWTIGRHHGLSASLSILLLSLGTALLSTCDTSGAGPKEQDAYQITEGACGRVVFAESIGADSSSAAEVVEAQKIEEYGQDKITLEAYVLEVADDDGNVPEPEFYALRVLDAETGHLVHSVSEVITDEGDLFKLLWCPD